jgi:hypothetical protein
MIAGRLLAVATVTLALGGPPAAAMLAAPPASDGVVWVLAPPWRSAVAVVEAAGGRPVGPVAPRVGQLAAGTAPDFAARLRTAGAWLVIDDTRLLALCGGRT